MKRLTTLLAALSVGVAALAGAAPANGAVIWDIEGHHAQGNFVPGGLGEYTFLVSNVGSTATSGPVEIEVALPAGVTTRYQPIIYFDQTWFAGFDGGVPPGWDCGNPAEGESSLTCHSIIDPVPPGARGLGRLTVYVEVDPGTTGALPAVATVSGGGGPTASTTEIATVGPLAATFGISPGTLKADAFDAAGVPDRRPASHPARASLSMDLNVERALRPNLYTGALVSSLIPIEKIRNLDVRLPRGFVGNPRAAAQCQQPDLLASSGSGTECPASSQIGVAQVLVQYAYGAWGPPTLITAPVYNVEPTRGALATFGLQVDSRPVLILASLDPKDHSIVTSVRNLNEALPLHFQRLTLWGVPGDPVHEPQRWNPQADGWGASSTVPRLPFLTLPSECGVPDTTDLTRLTSWQDGANVLASPLRSTPAQLHGCEQLSFNPTIDLAPDSVTPDSPTGLKVDIDLPQDENFRGRGTPPLRDAKVTLPEGMTINPSAADGLGACTDAQLGLGTNDPVSCPDAAKIGTIEALSPALEGAVGGSVYIRSQGSDDPESGDMFRMALVLEHKERGLLVKLPGSVKADPATGRLTAEFKDNPQLPVSKISVRLKGGARAPLATPPTCGEKTFEATMSSWGGQVSTLTDSFTVPCPAFGGFSPSFDAGPLDATGGAFSPFTALIERQERDQYLDGVELDLPTGMLAKLRGVPLCPDAKAAAGTCDIASRIGSATVGAGSGSPFYLEDQPVYLAGPYKGAPYSLSVAARAKAGPFDLGMVVVRQALYVDPTDAHITVKSDPVPTIVKGVPLRLRSIDVRVDRPRFTLNPTSCAAKQVKATFHSQQGSVSAQVAGFRVGDCRALPLKPKLKLALTGRTQLTDGRHPGLKATLTQGPGQAGLKRVAVKLPLSLALDPKNADSDSLCSFEESRKADPKCPASSIVGTAKAWTPLLDRPLEGPVFFSKNVRVNAKTGRQIRTLPALVIPLRGEVSLNLVGTSDTKRGKLVNTFATVPDAPVSRFELTLKGGKKGILVVNGRACKRSRTAVVEIDGQNGKTADQAPKIAAPCAKAGTAKGKRSAKRRPAARAPARH